MIVDGEVRKCPLRIIWLLVVSDRSVVAVRDLRGIHGG